MIALRSPLVIPNVAQLKCLPFMRGSRLGVVLATPHRRRHVHAHIVLARHLERQDITTWMRSCACATRWCYVYFSRSFLQLSSPRRFPSHHALSPIPTRIRGQARRTTSLAQYLCAHYKFVITILRSVIGSRTRAPSGMVWPLATPGHNHRLHFYQLL